MPPSQHLPLQQELLFQEKHVTVLDLCSCAVTDVLPGGGGRGAGCEDKAPQLSLRGLISLGESLEA